MVKAIEGTLIRCDPAVRLILKHLDANGSNVSHFIIEDLGMTTNTTGNTSNSSYGKEECVLLIQSDRAEQVISQANTLLKEHRGY